MPELQGGKRQQPTACPQGWLPAAIVAQLDLTCRQERYARRCVGIARFVYNRMVANDQAGRDLGLWLTPHELEKEFNTAKHINPSLAFVTQVSKFVAQGACRNYRNARSRWLSKEISKPGAPCFTGRAGPAPAPSWRHQAWQPSSTITTGASGSPTWAA